MSIAHEDAIGIEMDIGIRALEVRRTAPVRRRTPPSKLPVLSVILTASVLLPSQTDETIILGILTGGSALAMLASVMPGAWKRPGDEGPRLPCAEMDVWRMPALSALAPAALSRSSRIWMAVLRAYLVIAGGFVLLRIVMIALGQG